MSAAVLSQREGVFADNRKLPIHRWYPFIEGYSSLLVERALADAPSAVSIFDPFSGSGTTALTAAMQGRASAYTEVNPYLRWVAQVKTEASQLGAAASPGELQAVASTVRSAVGRNWGCATRDNNFARIARARKYFADETVNQIVGTLAVIDTELQGWGRDLARLAVASSLVASSNMLRRTDLRRRTVKDPRPASFAEEAIKLVNSIVSDVSTTGNNITATPKCLGDNALEPYAPHAPFDLIVTSPPYLNGTNYCRNTKLELLALGLIEAESDLEKLRPAMVTAGINNVSKANRPPNHIPAIDTVIADLEAATYDQRVPKMVIRYFSDMQAVFRRLNVESQPGAALWLDIGDSKYSGVHVKTDIILRDIATTAGWDHSETEVLRSRRSYDGSKLSQVLLKFKKGSEPR